MYDIDVALLVPEETKCFAREQVKGKFRCSCLTELTCKGWNFKECPFYKTEAQFKMDAQKYTK